jgi:hypothetical protein
MNRLANALRAVEENVQLDRLRDLRAQLGQYFFDRIDHFHDIGAGLALHT